MCGNLCPCKSDWADVLGAFFELWENTFTVEEEKQISQEVDSNEH